MKSATLWRYVGSAIAAMACGMLAATPTRANVLTLLPEQFQVTTGQTTWTKQPLGLQNGTFWTPVKLPAGSRFTRLIFYHWGFNATNSLSVVSLIRVKMGQPFAHEDILASRWETSYTGASANVPPVVVEVIPSPALDLVVRPGYRYYVSVTSGQSTVSGVKVYYSRP